MGQLIGTKTGNGWMALALCRDSHGGGHGWANRQRHIRSKLALSSSFPRKMPICAPSSVPSSGPSCAIADSGRMPGGEHFHGQHSERAEWVLQLGKVGRFGNWEGEGERGPMRGRAGKNANSLGHVRKKGERFTAERKETLPN